MAKCRIINTFKVFRLARDSLNRDELKSFLRGKSREEVKAILSSEKCGTTPLLVAALNGHCDVVKYLLDDWDVDVNQVASVELEDETIHHEATALWCAAVAGHLDVVETLLSFGAHTNLTTTKGSSALRAACFGGHLDMVKMLIDALADVNSANKFGNTCLMLACYKGYYDIAKVLIENNADIHRKTEIGKETALHECAIGGHLEILKMLLSHGAKTDDVNCNGMTPLLVAASAGHSLIVEYFISQLPCKQEEEVNALELLGATCMKEDHDDILAAHGYLRRAMNIRYESPVYPLVKPNVISPIAAYFKTREVSKFTELEKLISNSNAMRIQALLILERNYPCGHGTVAEMVLLVLKKLKKSYTEEEYPSIFGLTEQELTSILDSCHYSH